MNCNQRSRNAAVCMPLAHEQTCLAESSAEVSCPFSSALPPFPTSLWSSFCCLCAVLPRVPAVCLLVTRQHGEATDFARPPAPSEGTHTEWRLAQSATGRDRRAAPDSDSDATLIRRAMGLPLHAAQAAQSLLPCDASHAPSLPPPPPVCRASRRLRRAAPLLVPPASVQTAD